MFCTSCGAEIEESSNFCVKCGKQKTESQNVIKENEQEKNLVRPKANLRLIIGCILVLALILPTSNILIQMLLPFPSGLIASIIVDVFLIIYAAKLIIKDAKRR